MNSSDKSSFTQFFAQATDYPPYEWQGHLANGESYIPGDPSSHTGTPCQSRLIDIPTGLGKTAGVVLAWLWNSQSSISNLQSPPPWPRRLVYCLPMRTLVEQTEGEIKKWLRRLAAENGELGSLLPKLPRVVVLMGGEDPEDKDWDLHPEDPAILIGTQDMLLSRALNRGYGMSRYRWPMHFALLNNDALWVMDEVQLMGVGVETSAQLDWMREFRFKSRFPVKAWWMSATLGGDFLATSDNSDYKTHEFEGIKNEAGRSSFYLSTKNWMEATGTRELIAKAGRYGGTFANEADLLHVALFGQTAVQWREANSGSRNQKTEDSPTVAFGGQDGQQPQALAADRHPSMACRFHAPSAKPRTATASCLQTRRLSQLQVCRSHKNAPPAASAPRHRDSTDHPEAYRLHPGGLHS